MFSVDDRCQSEVTEISKRACKGLISWNWSVWVAFGKVEFDKLFFCRVNVKDWKVNLLCFFSMTNVS